MRDPRSPGAWGPRVVKVAGLLACMALAFVAGRRWKHATPPGQENLQAYTAVEAIFADAQKTGRWTQERDDAFRTQLAAFSPENKLLLARRLAQLVNERKVRRTGDVPEGVTIRLGAR